MHILWSLVLTLHIAGITAWVGGALYSSLILPPSLTLLDKTQRTSVMLQALRRYFRMSGHVVPAVLVSGWLMILHEGGFAVMPWTVNAMQALALVMAFLTFRAFSGPYQKARRAMRPGQETLDSLRLQILGLSALGVVTILTAALGHF
ncbi:hypothetical protein LOC54_06915 [Acetobacter sp. AN02]|uniref:hypothetical protein n=1 Tax=Acetobacter sp. AN02 TaxID=2894186 RepID=UPI0024344347|nr:hypothetical protein [Acetobacter sp. AN02]MDG6094842.1 hypothetical protein [Acetobacter sp. AN02]